VCVALINPDFPNDFIWLGELFMYLFFNSTPANMSWVLRYLTSTHRVPDTVLNILQIVSCSCHPWNLPKSQIEWVLFFICLFGWLVGFFCFLGPYLWHMEVPRLRIESELDLLDYTTAIATPDLSCICDLHHSSQQCQILNPLSEARDWTYILMDTSQVHYHWATMGTSKNGFIV